MSICPLCSGHGDIPLTQAESVVNELGVEDAWKQDLRRLLKLLHQVIIDDEIERGRRTTNPKRYSS